MNITQLFSTNALVDGQCPEMIIYRKYFSVLSLILSMTMHDIVFRSLSPDNPCEEAVNCTWLGIRHNFHHFFQGHIANKYMAISFSTNSSEDCLSPEMYNFREYFSFYIIVYDNVCRCVYLILLSELFLCICLILWDVIFLQLRTKVDKRGNCRTCLFYCKMPITNPPKFLSKCDSYICVTHYEAL